MLLDFWERFPQLFIVVKLGRRIAGYSITCVQGERAELASIAVDPLFQSQGVATAVMNYTTLRLRRRKVSKWTLMVRINNERAIRFYRHFGFARTRTVRKYYEDSTDAWRMEAKVESIKRRSA